MSLRLGILASLALCLAGCGLELGIDRVTNVCLDSVSCGEGSCVEGRCVTPSLAEPLRVVFEVVAARDESQPSAGPSLFEPAEVSGPRAHDLLLREQVIVSGGAFFGAAGVRVPAQLTFTPRPLFSGAPTSSVRASSDAADFAVVLDAGRVYDVLVEPTASTVAGLTANDLFPPLYVDGVTAESFADGRVDFYYPAGLFDPCVDSLAACTYKGQVLSVDALGTERALAGVRVRAIDGLGRSVSSSVVTADDGSYAIRLLAGKGPIELRVSPVSEQSSLPVGVFPLLAVGDADVLRLPELVPATLEAVVGYEPGSEAEGISFLDGAAVSFESVRLDAPELGGKLSFRRSVASATTALGPGSFVVDLLPGTYRVVVTPADRDRASVLLTELTIDPRAAGERIKGQYYRVPLRSLVQGVVYKPSLDPASQAAVQALRVAPPVELDSMDVRRFARASRATAGSDGVYALPLDVGFYDLLVQPGEGSGFAWELYPDLDITGVSLSIYQDLEVHAPVPVGGVVRDAAGLELPFATVRAYVLLESGGVVRARQIAETTTNAAGNYEVLLPGGL